MRRPKTRRDTKFAMPLPPENCFRSASNFKGTNTFKEEKPSSFTLLKETSDQRDELVICTESESQGFPVGEEGAVNREEKQPVKMEIMKF